MLLIKDSHWLCTSEARDSFVNGPILFCLTRLFFQWIADIEDLPRAIQKQLFDEILDRDVQKGVWYLFLYNFHNLAECFSIIRTQYTCIFLSQIKELFVINILTVSELEVEEPIVNWSLEMTDRLGSRLYALWNRTAGDCLLDSALQATWGIFDRDNTLRRALANSLMEGANTWVIVTHHNLTGNFSTKGSLSLLIGPKKEVAFFHTKLYVSDFIPAGKKQKGCMYSRCSSRWTKINGNKTGEFLLV